ncbi:MAG: MFS transporter, partial [Actinobacteria bacterium]|nr:MFS transporter [Actinomycetota bacterium]
GLQIVYWVDAATFVVAFFYALRLSPLKPAGALVRPSVGAIGEGLRYAVTKPELRGVFLVDLAAMVLAMPRALFPALGLMVFGGPAAVGFLYAGFGAGALLGALFSGSVGTVVRPGRATLWCVALWGVAMAAFGVTTWLPLALVFLAVAGAADVFSAVFRNTILQFSIPDSMRGRMSSVQLAVVTGGPRLGDFRAGGMAALGGAMFSVVTGGIACVVAVGALALWLPSFRRWELSSAHRIESEPAEDEQNPDQPNPPQETANA